jgi:hypothetical protein
MLKNLNPADKFPPQIFAFKLNLPTFGFDFTCQKNYISTRPKQEAFEENVFRRKKRVVYTRTTDLFSSSVFRPFRLQTITMNDKLNL